MRILDCRNVVFMPRCACTKTCSRPCCCAECFCCSGHNLIPNHCFPTDNYRLNGMHIFTDRDRMSSVRRFRSAPTKSITTEKARRESASSRTPTKPTASSTKERKPSSTRPIRRVRSSCRTAISCGSSIPRSSWQKAAGSLSIDRF